LIWLALVVLATLCMAPFAMVTWRRSSNARGRREAALALHRAQLDELERDRAEGRLPEPEYATATLEIQRRLLAAAASADQDGPESSRKPLFAALAVVPIAALLLYLVGGSPGLPDMPRAELLRIEQARAVQEDALIAQLRTKLSQLDPTSAQARQGYVLLGNAEASRQHMAAAADAWKVALAAGFDPTLAVETAEAMSEAAGHVTDDAKALFQRALDAAPPDAPWRVMAERRLSGAPMRPAPPLN
jgi:cytochrome c-type biogenesis protein CcmH